MSAENKAVARRYLEEALNKGNLQLIEELIAVTFIDHGSGSSSPEAKSPARLAQQAAMVRTSFPDLHITIEDMIAEGDKVVYRYSMRGTHQAEFMGIAATGRSINVTGIRIFRVNDGKIQEAWEGWDELGWMRQLGLLPD